MCTSLKRMYFHCFVNEIRYLLIVNDKLLPVVETWIVDDIRYLLIRYDIDKLYFNE